MVPMSTTFDLVDVAISEAQIFVDNSFPLLHKLAKKEQEIIFKDYVVKFALVITYMTMKLFGNVHNQLMSSVCTCFDKDMPIDFYYPGDDPNKEFFYSSLRLHTDEQTHLFSPQLRRNEFAEKEFHALAALVLTETDSSFSEEAEQLVTDIRQEIFQDLESYYQNELCLSDISMRLGHLMTLNHTFQECKSRHKVLVHFYSTFFDVYLTDKYMQAVGLL